MQLKIFDSFDSRHSDLYRNIQNLTQPICQFYPNYNDWFKNIFIPGLKKKERLFIIAQNKADNLTGCILIKNTATEKKICTLFIKPEYRRQGIATALIRQTIQLLGITPLISVPQENMGMILPLLIRLGFYLSTCQKDVYRKGYNEYYFSGKRANTLWRKRILALYQQGQQPERY